MRSGGVSVAYMPPLRVCHSLPPAFSHAPFPRPSRERLGGGVGQAWPLAGGARVLQGACSQGGGTKRPFAFPIRTRSLEHALGRKGKISACAEVAYRLAHRCTGTLAASSDRMSGVPGNPTLLCRCVHCYVIVTVCPLHRQIVRCPESWQVRIPYNTLYYWTPALYSAIGMHIALS